jgi:urease accessory protein
VDLIRTPISPPPSNIPKVLLTVDRHTLAKRRWRASADDGREFGFDLDEPLRDGAPFFQSEAASYVISQQPEPIFEITPASPRDAARIGWLIGNLHFSLEISGDVIRVPNDSALRQMLEREHIVFVEASRVFHPYRHGHVH